MKFSPSSRRAVRGEVISCELTVIYPGFDYFVNELMIGGTMSIARVSLATCSLSPEI